MTNKDRSILGLIYDVIEDIDGIIFQDLNDFGILDNIIEALKIADMYHNYNQQKISKISQDKQDWFKLKYGSNKKIKIANIEEK